MIAGAATVAQPEKACQGRDIGAGIVGARRSGNERARVSARAWSAIMFFPVVASLGAGLGVCAVRAAARRPEARRAAAGGVLPLRILQTGMDFLPSRQNRARTNAIEIAVKC